MQPSPKGAKPKRIMGRRRGLVPAGVLVAGVLVAATAWITVWRPAPATLGAPVPWSRLGTQDVHSLAFDPADAQHLYFGHHQGLQESRDGGRSWTALSVRDDAMSMANAADGSIIIAGHNVFAASEDGGRTWHPIAADLPTLDIHGFTRDPADPRRMWAYPATGGSWESRDLGSHWTRVQQENVGFPLALRSPNGTQLLGVAVSGFVSSTDGGRTWTTLTGPPAYPLTSLAASGDGAVIYAGSINGVWRSTDHAQTWTATTYTGSALALATTGDGRTVALVSRDTLLFRSSDAGGSWSGP